MKIVFTDVYGLGIEHPQPAYRFIPDWYKDMKSYVGEVKTPEPDGSTSPTVKRCMPVFDAITAGYIITVPYDITVSIKDNRQMFSCLDPYPVKFHPIEQAEGHPYQKPYPYPKWMNPWAIKTPKGYSTLFVQPFHRDSVFTILPGIVDTDEFNANVNFPMVINDTNFEGVIKSGTPMAQVIPFKREEWEIEIGDKGEIDNHKNTVEKLRTKKYDKYKKIFWSKKEYN